MIELKNIKWIVSPNTPAEKVILNGIDLNINSGEFITVIGTNGAGKSTLLNVISGECAPTSGTITIAGDNVTEQNSDVRARSVARVFQDPLIGSCGELTVAENMALACARGGARGFSKALNSKLREQFKESLSRLNLGLETKLDTLMNQLSGGQRQAICLLMSTLSPAKILLLDEHTSALDPKTAETIMMLTEKIVHENKLTTLMITHSLAHAVQYGTRTILLHEGKISRQLFGVERASLTATDLLALYGKITS